MASSIQRRPASQSQRKSARIGPRHGVQAGLVAHRLGDGDALLAVLAEGGPVLRHRGVVVDQAAVGLDVQGGGGDALRGREAGEEGVGLDGPRVLRAEVPGPGVDKELAAAVSRDLRPNLVAFGDLGLEQPANFLVESAVHHGLCPFVCTGVRGA